MLDGRGGRNGVSPKPRLENPLVQNAPEEPDVLNFQANREEIKNRGIRGIGGNRRPEARGRIPPSDIRPLTSAFRVFRAFRGSSKT